MADLHIQLPDDLEKRLRRTIVERYDGKKGDLSIAIAEAVELWLKQKI
jgi:hypothetical protein